MKAARAQTESHSWFCGAQPEICHDCTPDRIRFDVGAKDTLASAATIKVVHVYVFGLQEDDELEIQRVFKDECDPLWGPALTCGEPTLLTQCRPEAFVVVPGRYEIDLEGHDLDSEHVRFQVSEVHAEYAALRFKQEALCCCRQEKNERG